MIKYSICIVTMNRKELTRECIEHALDTHGVNREEVELLIGDNASTEPGMVEMLSSLSPNILLKSKENLGHEQMMNQLLLRASGEYYGLPGCDIWMPDNWLSIWETYYEKLPSPGMLGYQCAIPVPGPRESFGGIYAHPTLGGIFGPTFITRKHIERVGFFCEEYGKYGYGDADYGVRCALLGYTNYYVDNQYKAEHKGHDINDNSDYRKFKWQNLEDYAPIINARFAGYADGSIPLHYPAPQLIHFD